MAFIDRHKTRSGVEPICRVVPIAPSTYYAARRRPPSDRALRNEYLKGRDQARVEGQLPCLRGRQDLAPAQPRGIAVTPLHRRAAPCVTSALGARGTSPRSRPTTPPGQQTFVNRTLAHRRRTACGCTPRPMTRYAIDCSLASAGRAVKPGAPPAPGPRKSDRPSGAVPRRQPPRYRRGMPLLRSPPRVPLARAARRNRPRRRRAGAPPATTMRFSAFPCRAGARASPRPASCRETRRLSRPLLRPRPARRASGRTRTAKARPAISPPPDSHGDYYGNYAAARIYRHRSPNGGEAVTGRCPTACARPGCPAA
jgi:hypothetical protein